MTTASHAPRPTSTMRGVAQILGSRAAVLLLALAVQVLIARILGPEGRGSYDAALLWGTLAIMLLNPGIESASVYYVASGALRLRQCISGTAWLLAGILLVTVAGTLLVAAAPPPFLSSYLDKTSGVLLLLGALTGVSTMAVQTSLALSTTGQRFVTLSSGQVIHRALQLLGALLFIAALGLGPAGAVLAILAADLVIMGAVVRKLLRESAGTEAASARRAAHLLLSYGRRFYIGKLGGQFNFRIGPLVLATSASVADLGLYGQASAVAIQYLSIPESIYTVLLPKMSSDPRAAARQTAQTARFMAAFGALAVVVSLAVATLLFRALFTEEFLPAVPVFQVLLAAFAVRALGKVHEPYLLAVDRPGLISIAIAVGLTLNVLLLLALYKPFGLVGVGWALFGNYTASSAVLVGSTIRLGGVPVRHYVVWQAEDSAALRSIWKGIIKTQRD